ncbi:Anion-transporting ATPase-like domain [Dillenia turbinata]|uniref:Anion-transporting ATPase-like domain n=1 Tax=Dillenia turbinata TaxID=194707 RepID=A0AAN8YYQ1_9MAGN
MGLMFKRLKVFLSSQYHNLSIPLTVTLRVFYDEGVQAAELIGCAQFPLKKLEPCKVKDVWLNLAKDLEIKKENKNKVRAIATPVESFAVFDEMVSGAQRRYYMLGGKGGVGKTSCAVSLAIKFANNGHPTLVVSIDPAHSLSDLFA